MPETTPGDEEPKPPRKKSGAGDQASTFGRMVAYSHIAYTFIAAFGLPAALGIWLDAETEFSPWGTILGVGLGLVLSTIVAYRETRSTGARLRKPGKSRNGTNNDSTD